MSLKALYKPQVRKLGSCGGHGPVQHLLIYLLGFGVVTFSGLGSSSLFLGSRMELTDGVIIGVL